MKQAERDVMNPFGPELCSRGALPGLLESLEVLHAFRREIRIPKTRSFSMKVGGTISPTVRSESNHLQPVTGPGDTTDRRVETRL